MTFSSRGRLQERCTYQKFHFCSSLEFYFMLMALSECDQIIRIRYWYGSSSLFPSWSSFWPSISVDGGLKRIKNDLIVQRCTTCIFLLPSCKCFRDRWFQIKWWSDHAWRLSDVVPGIQHVPRCTHRRFRLLRNSPAKLLYEGCHAQARRICKFLIDWFSKYTVITNKEQLVLYMLLNDFRS